MIKGHKQNLSEADLWNLDEDQLAEFETIKLEKEWLPVANE